MAALAWGCFFLYRKNLEGADLSTAIQDHNFWYGLVIIPSAWLLFYSLFDKYRDIYRLSRLATLGRTFLLTACGVMIIFFSLLLDDAVPSYTTYYQAVLMLFVLHFGLTAITRMILLTRASRRLKAGKIAYRTILIGGNEKAIALYKDMAGRKKKLGNWFLGYISTSKDEDTPLSAHIPCLGTVEDLAKIVAFQEVEEAIIAVETSEHSQIRDVLNTLFDFEETLLVKIIPDIYDIMLGSVKMNHVYGAVLIEVRPRLMPTWQRVVKRGIDVSVAATMLLLLAPIYAYIAWRVRRSSTGPIFFKQERIGKNAEPFQIIKFRSMYTNAEEQGPQLSQDNDPRMTPWGAIMRKWRLDELPQFWNVLVGEMSLVGPRPERQFYIDQIMARAPHYRHLLKVRPGITSWGQVKYGYASNIEEMLQRLRFDVLYLENMSLALDFKIMFYTALVLMQGRGK